MLQYILLKFITLIHIMFVLFIVVTPFTNSTYLLFLHFIFVPFMLLHWMLNNNTCILTVIEKKLRKEIYGETKDDDCITCKLIEPVYDFRNNYQTFSTIIYSITILLWLISAGKLFYKYHTGNITSFRDLFIF